MQEHIIDLSERYALLNENHVYILYKIELMKTALISAKAAQYVRIYLPCWTS
ncbi:hypothetical protein MZA99_01060 [Haemophilus influenzae]